MKHLVFRRDSLRVKRNRREHFDALALSYNLNDLLEKALNYLEQGLTTT